MQITKTKAADREASVRRKESTGVGVQPNDGDEEEAAVDRDGSGSLHSHGVRMLNAPITEEAIQAGLPCGIASIPALSLGQLRQTLKLAMVILERKEQQLSEREHACAGAEQRCVRGVVLRHGCMRTYAVVLVLSWYL